MNDGNRNYNWDVCDVYDINQDVLGDKKTN
jgi:hypothetical protein